ncbi:MAG TPA: flavin reductase family protein, partial [Candidatus Polarisedimenticolia bacterium]|nr:flavin reductase family protein [Candidatus Polarisedimenticolia bacterium]
MAVPAEEFRRALRRWASGVSIVTTRSAEGIHGITVSSFCSLSLDPPLILICIDRKTASHPLIARERCFGVNILRADQAPLSDLAAGRAG